MKITILTDNPNSWFIKYVDQLKKELSVYDILHIYSQDDIQTGDILFLLSCEKIIPKEKLLMNKNNIVVHPSKLPKGRGWSPLAWQILENKNEIPVTLFEASENVDAGNIYIVDYIKLEGHELNEEIKDKQGLITIKMVKQFIENYHTITSSPQIGTPSFYKKRTKLNSELDINKSLKDQFNLLRIVDNEKYPAFFNLNGNTYILKIYKET